MELGRSTKQSYLSNKDLGENLIILAHLIWECQKKMLLIR